jgi:beta-lactam-binding protein with PASTA domain
VARAKPVRFMLGPLVAVLFLAGSAHGSQHERRCGDPWDAPGYSTPARQYVMHNVLCMDLQLAQDKLQAAYFDNIRSRDGTRYDRNQWDDRAWVVVAQDPPAGHQGRANTPITLTVLRYGDPGAPPVPDRTQPGRLPNLVCFDLQEAQDTLQAAGFWKVSAEDASGQGRGQFFDQNWTVVGQRPGPGPNMSKSTEILLRALKDDEPKSCPYP